MNIIARGTTAMRLLALLVLAIGLLWLAESRAEIKISDGTNTSQSDSDAQPHPDKTDPADEPHASPTDPADEPYAEPTDPADEPHPDRPIQQAPEQPADGTPPADASQPPPRKKPAGSGSEIMSAEQGEEIGRKLEEFEKGQQKLVEKIGELEKDYQFLKATMRRPRAHP